jgi:hypothetical protein
MQGYRRDSTYATSRRDQVLRAAMLRQREPLLTHPFLSLGDLILYHDKRLSLWIYGTPKLHQIRVGFEHLVVSRRQLGTAQADHGF